KGDFEGALADTSRDIKLDPSQAGPWFIRACAWKGKGDLGRALDDFTRVIELNPDWAEAYAERGLVLLLKGRGREAQRYFEECLAGGKDSKPSLEQFLMEEMRLTRKKF